MEESKQPPQSTPEKDTVAMVPRGANPDEDILAQLEERAAQLRETMLDLNVQAVTFIRERPVICIAGAVAVGYVVGRAAARRWLR
ncbi:MAG: hypothetical protein AAFX99_13755 [Myxococcota bacterium]